jgi:hypothetical protein
MAAEHRDQVDGALILRDNLHTVDYGLDLGTDRLLHRRYDYILPARLPPPPFVEHAQRFADPRRITQKHLQAPARLASFASLYAAEQFTGIRPAVFTLRHLN